MSQQLVDDCVAEVETLALVDPCAAAALHPPPAACDDLFDALGTVAPEGHYLMAFRAFFIAESLGCDPDFTWDVDEECYDADCAYDPVQARACLDLAHHPTHRSMKEYRRAAQARPEGTRPSAVKRPRPRPRPRR